MNSLNAHSLTAYKLEFSYRKRNNPLKEELRKEIANNEMPNIHLSDLLSSVISKSNSQAYLKANGFAFKLTKIERYEPFENGQKYVILPDAGKSDLPFTVYKENGYGPYHYGAGAASTYSHNIYLYEFPDATFMICHRKGRSGCKTVLTNVFNVVLKEKGIKLETSIILPVKADCLEQYKPQKLILKYRGKESSDIADHLSKKQKNKEIIIREVSLALEVSDNAAINKILGDRITNKITKEAAFAEIKNELNYDKYNDADVVFKIGKVKRAVKWDNLEDLFEGKDITEDLEKMGGEHEINISKCADNYVQEIRSRGL